jgi:fermentation-respiration switch protein FrsA (DUF1100 family)
LADEQEQAQHVARARRRWARRLVWVAVLVVVAYAALIGYLLVNERALIFRPRRTAALVAASLGLNPREVALTTALGDRTIAWEMRTSTPAPYWVLYLHGNDATIRSGGNVQRYHQLRSLGMNVLAPEYPGYGSIAGDPSEGGLQSAARAAYDHLRRDLGVPADQIVIFGWSLGSGGAVPLARDVDEAALIVEGAFSSVLGRAQAAYPFLPISWMVHHPFLSEDAIAETHSPTLFLHSPEDRVIPFSDGERLHARARDPKQLVSVRGGHVTPNLDDEDRYLAAIRDFLAERAGWNLAAPRRSVGLAIRGILDREGLDAAVNAYERFRQEGDSVWNLAEYELEHVGRTLRELDRHAEAVAILGLNARIFADSPLAQFHLGVAARDGGDTTTARAAFTRSLALDASPSNTSHAALASLE